MSSKTSGASYLDVARAARLCSALAAGDVAGWSAVIAEARHDGRMEKLALALAVRHVQVCGEYYDTDRQAFLDSFAFDANALANREGHGDAD